MGRKITNNQWDKFLDNVAATANISLSAEMAGFKRTAFYERKAIDEDFARRFELAYEQGIDALEEEALRRAFKGIDDPVFYKGDVVGHIKKYSDSLAMFMLKGAKPEKYRDNFQQPDRSDLSGAVAKLIDKLPS